MESGFPMLNSLLQHTLRSLCSSSDSSGSTSKWVYAVFWRILPRNFPPPKWEYGGGALDRARGNKRNWILVWEDGFCDFHECQQAGAFGPGVFFKMAHEVYCYGEGLVGKVAADSSHRWVFRETGNENNSCIFSSWIMSTDPKPKAWEFQFNSGIQTIALISVREGIVQLGSLNKVEEDHNLAIDIQRKFCYLHSIPGAIAMQRPYVTIQSPNPFKLNDPYSIETSETSFFAEDKHQLAELKRPLYSQVLNELPIKSVNLGWSTPHNGLTGPPVWSFPPLLPAISGSFGAFLSSMNSAAPPNSCFRSLADNGGHKAESSGDDG
ncbi:hypothetical protein Nepgr_005842 [Nepenthes gracilis]|uniref:Transcription factor MYC/MYB N-terminal domain-containing protein n=1 Tax=Nepenthes gracilis TaxID=150966 RepID=A0AAD3XGU7_NEPGR|nr:hypothetical protein Nepgr_005842 [Nepenthes gracilis]